MMFGFSRRVVCRLCQPCAIMASVGRNEVGYSLCETPGGQLRRGAQAEGTPTRVTVPLGCPHGSQFIGIFHTHPGGSARPSAIDLREAHRVGAKVLCIRNDHEVKCWRLRRP